MHRLACALPVFAVFGGIQPTGAQAPPLDRVLAFPPAIPGEELHADRGAAGAWHRIRKLATTASLLHVTAHPDDEHAGMLALASRGWGARTALLSLNRGEGGANALGTELFDALGLIRTRELVLSGRYYGLDDLYFTTAVDYGYSKTVAETFSSWDREAVLEDMVRVIRLNRPLVVVSRFHGSERDGHGNHHAAGVLTPAAVAAAADPDRFPDQIAREGLRPWRVLRLYRGGVRLGEPSDVLVGTGEYSPALGMTHQRWASLGLSLQRSQTSGRVRRGDAATYRYERLGAAGGGAPDEEAGAGMAGERDAPDADFLAGLDTRLTGMPALLGEEVGREVAAQLAEVQAAIDGVVRDFDFTAPEGSVAGLARGLSSLRAVLRGAGLSPETAFHLAVKERQFEDAIVAAAGVEAVAELQREGGGAGVVPGEAVAVEVGVRSAVPDGVGVAGVRVRVRGADSRTAATAAVSAEAGTADSRASSASASFHRIEVRIPADAPPARPYFSRSGIDVNHYSVTDSADLHLPWRRAGLAADLDLVVGGVSVTRTAPVVGAAPRLPYGTLARRAEVLPAVSVSLTPRVRMAVGGQADQQVGPVLARVEAHAPNLAVETRLELPAGWTAHPPSVRHELRSRGEVAELPFTLQPPTEWSGEIAVHAVACATASGETREYRSGYQTIDHRDLPLARLHRPARTIVRSLASAPLTALSVGYVMGVGDEVPAAIEALGATVRLLDKADLAGGDLDALDAIVIGTRAYAVRRDLVENNQGLFDYARAGGHVVVLYQTQEFVPSAMAPYPASLPRSAEEVSEEDAPVRLLEPSHPLLTTPNRIAESDFAGWLEQRGSKFFSDWDSAYTPLVETNDAGQAPQRGIWLTADVGEGRYSYLALALHRQLPFGVPGAYRILANALWPR